MALTNLTERVNQKTVEERYCSAEFTQGIHGELIFLSVVNICLSISAVLGNTLILVALNKETSLHQASKLLYSTLAITDLGVAIIVEPLAVTYWTSVVNEKWNICYYTHFARDISAYALSSISFFILTAISFDRLLALTLGLRYRQVVTLKRTLTSVLVSWVFSSIVASSIFFEIQIILWFAKVGFALGIVTTVFSYTKIFFTLRQNQIRALRSDISRWPATQAIPLNVARYKKAVYSALWVQLALVICYLPNNIVVALEIQGEIPLAIYLTRQFTFTLVNLNSSLNPLVYCWKITEVRQAVKETLRNIFF